MRTGGFKLMKIFGIEVFIDYSWIVIFVLINWIFAISYYPALFPEFSSLMCMALGFITAVLFFSSALIHELAHSIISIKNGLAVRRITLFLFGGVAELFEEPKDAKSEFKIAIAGPLTSVVLAAVYYAVGVLFQNYYYFLPGIAIFFTLFQVNLILAVFNMLPGFPLDGGRVLRSINWYFKKDLKEATKVASNGGKIVAAILIVGGVIEIIMSGFFSGVWLVLIGLFLNQAAGQSYLELLIHEELEKQPVDKIMNSNIVFVRPQISIDELMSEYFIKYSSRSFPVIQDENVIGLVSLKEIKKMPPEVLPHAHVWDLMKSFPHELFVNPSDRTTSALRLMLEKDITFVPVKEDGKLKGVISLENIADYLNEQHII